MYRAFIFIFVLSLSLPVFASKTIVTETPVYNPYYGAYYGGDYTPKHRYHRRNSSLFSDINELEMYAMNKNFTRDSDLIRIERLESLAFGAVQQGDILTRYDNVRNAILSRPKQNYKTSVLRNISDYFNGQLTGYTPSINSSTNYNNIYQPSGFGNSSSVEYNTPWGKSFRTNNYGVGSGSGIHILD